MRDPREKIYREKRPWGGFTQFTHNEVSTVKILRIDPGQKNSLQYHHHRSEMWVALDKGVEVTVGEKTWRSEKFEEIFIPQGAKHRVGCLGKKPVRVMEISFGQFDESDVVRVEDDYGRA